MSRKAEATTDFLRIIVAYFLPPLAVMWQVGLRGAFWLNLLFTLFFYVPGIVHAIWIVTTTDDSGRDAGPEGRRDFWRVLVAGFIPPLGVFLQVGLGFAFWVNIVFTLFFYIPGILHALWVITHRD
jgi:uncharacterized membrane protein YqaE (UPF0057 family)